MKINILQPKHLRNPRDAFVATFVSVVGDGDEFHKFSLAPIYRTSGYENQIEELVRLLDAMDEFQWTDTNSYSDLEHFNKWFQDADNGEADPFLRDGFIATLDSYEITYYDEDGIEHAVAINK
jgi:hypothetical protein